MSYQVSWFDQVGLDGSIDEGLNEMKYRPLFIFKNIYTSRTIFLTLALGM